MDVEAGGVQPTVAELLLEELESHAGLVQVRTTGVAEPMRRDVGRLGPLALAAEQALDSSRGERLTTAWPAEDDEQRDVGCVFVGRGLRTLGIEVSLEGGPGGSGDHGVTLASAFTMSDEHLLAAPIQVGETDAQGFGEPQSRPDQQPHQGFVPPGAEARREGRDLSRGGRAGQGRWHTQEGRAGRLTLQAPAMPDAWNGITTDHAHHFSPVEELGEGDDAAIDGADGKGWPILAGTQLVLHEAQHLLAGQLA